MVNFADIAKKKIAEVERPQLAPVGNYRWQVQKLPTLGTITGKDGREWDTVTFPVKVVEHLEDVDAEDYKGDLRNVTSRVQFMFNKQDEAAFDQTLFRLRTFLEKHMGVADESMSLNEALNASVGGQFIGTFQHRPNKDNPEEIFGEISKTAPLD